MIDINSRWWRARTVL